MCWGRRISYLSSYSDLFRCLITHRTALRVGIVEYNGDCGFGYSSLALFVDQFLKITNSHLGQIGNT